MTVLNEIRDSDDPRNKRQPPNPVTPPPQPQLAAPPPEPPAPQRPPVPTPTPTEAPATDDFVPDDGVNISDPVNEQQPVVSPQPVVPAEEPNNPLAAFPTINDINTDVAEQVAGQTDAGLEATLNTIQNQSLNGQRYPFFTEVESERSRLNRMLDNSNNQLRTFIRDQARREAANQLVQPINPRDLETFKKRDLNPGLDLDPNRALGGWGIGFLREVKKQAGQAVQRTGLSGIFDDPVVKKFRPLGDFNQWLGELKENPIQLLNPIGVLAGQIQREGEFGDFGNGLFGAAMYALSLPGNVVQGGLTDLHNLITGQRPAEGKLPNVTQSMIGQDYSFSELSKPVQRVTTDPVTGEQITQEISAGANPLAVVGGKENPETIGELKERSWIWRLSPAALLPDEAELPDFLPQRTVQAVEFGVGLALDVLTPEPGDLVRLGKPLLKATGIIRPGTEVAQEVPGALARTTPSDITRVEPEVITINPREITVDDIFNPNKPRPQLDPETIDVPAITVLDDATVRRELPELPEADPLRAVNSPTRLPDINDVLNNRNYSQGSIEEILAATGLDLNKAINTELTPRVSPIAALPPAGQTGTGRVELFRRISQGELDGVDLTPEVTSIVRRSNAQLTQLAADAGHLPQRNSPLSARRIELLNEQYPGMYERYGQPLHRISSSQLAQKALPPERLPLADAIKSKFDLESVSDLRKVTPEELQAARVGDFVMDKLVNAPKNIREVAAAARRMLPRGLVDFDNLEEVSELLRNEQIQESLLGEVQTLANQYVEQVDMLNLLMDSLDETLPDIGRRNVLSDAGFSRLPQQSPSVMALPDIPVDEEMVAAFSKREWMHGTRVAFDDFASIDPIQGASRSEVGTAVHFTLNTENAVNHAIKPVNRNTPNIGQNVRNIGRVISTRVSPRNLVDSGAPMTDELKVLLRESVKEVNLPANVSRNLRSRLTGEKSYAKFINDIDDVLERGFSDEPFPEEIALNLQRVIARNLRSKGVDGVVSFGEADAQLSLFNPAVAESIGELSTNRFPNDLVSQATAYRNSSKDARLMFPDSNYAEVNFRESQATMLTRMTEDTAQQLEDVKTLTNAVVDETAAREMALRRKAWNNRQTRQAQREARWRKQNTDTIKHFSTPNTTFC